MTEQPIISSLLENDLYKFSMGQAFLHNFPKTTAKIEFKERDGVKLGKLKSIIDEQLDHLCSLRYQPDESAYFTKFPWFTSEFVDYLDRLYLKRDNITTGIDENGQLTMVAEGVLRDDTYFEIPCLAIVSEAYMNYYLKEKGIKLSDVLNEGDRRLTAFISKLKKCYQAGNRFTLADFGLRRRFSASWHAHVIERLLSECPEFFVGTSNVYLAKKFGTKPIGTFAHEWFMAIQGDENVRLSNVQRVALDTWAKEYRGELGIALSDIFGFRAFLHDFDKYFAKLFDGCRHDSGNPITWGHMLIDHYKKLGIDPTSKVGCWSDALDADRAVEIAEEFNGKIKISFGIGTNLTNNLGIPPLNMVMKLVESNGNPVCKLSDSLSKGMCHDEQYINYVKQVYHYKSIDED